MSGYTDLDAPPRRGVHRVVGFGAGAALLFLGFAASRNEWHFLEEELKEKRGMHAAAAEPTCVREHSTRPTMQALGGMLGMLLQSKDREGGGGVYCMVAL